MDSTIVKGFNLNEEKQKWSNLVQEMPTSENETGRITIIGSGIKSIGHLTLEAVGFMKSCDKVFYLVADPATEVYIKEMRPDAMDLYAMYDDGKDRYETYVQISEVILQEARKGVHVAAVFYGHAGVFCLPPHRILQIAKRERIAAKMLAAPSAEDCLFADLEIDPAFPGCQSFEATDMLLRKRKLFTDIHTVLWQVGCVGKTDFQYQGFGNEKLHVLIDFLQDIYGRDYEIVHYIGSQYAVCDPVIEKFKLSEFKMKKVQEKIKSISTFYIPPKDVSSVDENMLKELGFHQEEISRGFKKAFKDISSYGATEKKALAALKDWRFPINYSFVEPTNMSRKLVQLCLNPAEEKMSNLTEDEQKVVRNGDSGAIRRMLKPHGEMVAGDVVVVAVVIIMA
ncbi:uncharacterized protein LOC128225238 [Mya arenaria]|uniref:uncharacterized protein LOC128225238 n=1 Tax=Mya arenaria TaxID=6604 RepID=UPI0022E1E060|nr:uncharacterized protein LOC128225238 [Mya arenaria]